MQTLRAVVLIAGCSFAAAVGAASQRTFVASYGVDTAICSIAQPCRGFTRAMTQTNSGGEIIVLDSAGYGSVNIAQDVSIIAPRGIFAGITVFAGTAGVGILFPATNVKLRGLTIVGQGGIHGISINADARIEIVDCEVSGMNFDGLQALGNPNLSIQDSRFLNNGRDGIGYHGGAGPKGHSTFERVVSRGNVGFGIYVGASTATVIASTVERNGQIGIFGQNTTYMTVRDSVVMQNGSSGVLQSTGYLRIEHSTVAANGGWGVIANQGAEAWMVGNTISDNQQNAEGASQVCACDATSQGFVNGNTVHGATQYGFESIGVIGSFGNNSTDRQLGGHNFSPIDRI